MTWGAAAGTVFHSGGGLPGNPSPQATDASPPSTCRWKVGKRHAGGEPAVPHAARRAHRLRCEALAETAPPSRIPEDEHQGERMRMRLLRTPAHAAAATAGPFGRGGRGPELVQSKLTSSTPSFLTLVSCHWSVRPCYHSRQFPKMRSPLPPQSRLYCLG